jgi:hypothetical protein
MELNKDLNDELKKSKKNLFIFNRKYDLYDELKS